MKRLFQGSMPGRWMASLAHAFRGARVHPSAALIGDGFTLSRGAAVSRGCVLRCDGAGRVTLGAGAWLARDVEIETASQVSIGAGTTIQRRCGINGSTRVGAGCIFAPDVFVSSGTHPFRDIAHLPIREQESRLAAQGTNLDRPVWIQDDCWIGTHAVVAPGVTIGKGSVIGANSVVTRDVAPYSVVAGAPARVIGQRLQWNPPGRVDPDSEFDAPYVLCNDQPLLVALRRGPGDTFVRVHVDCTRRVRIVANGEVIDLTVADGFFLVPVARGLPFGASLAIEVPAGDREAVRFRLFEVISATETCR